MRRYPSSPCRCRGCCTENQAALQRRKSLRSNAVLLEKTSQLRVAARDPDSLPSAYSSPDLRFVGQVHQTMSPAIASTTAISRKITHIARFPFLIAVIVLVAAACAPLAPRPEHAAPCPVCAVCAQQCPACPQCPAPPKPAPAEARYEAKPFGEIPGWPTAALAPSLRAFVTGCERLAAGSPLARPCREARELPAGDEPAARRFFESAFTAYSIVAPDGATEGLTTGYYEPVLDGSRSSSATNRYPVFGVPPDLIAVDLAAQHPELRGLRLRGRVEGRRLLPYLSRGEIDARGTAFQAPVLAWVADPVELFFMQIQGSGQIRLGSGERMRLGYAEQNGHPYRSLGRHLIERGELTLEHASMQGIKAWALANPAKLQQALEHNPSYVFFRELPAVDGPIGALGAPLTAGYSMAVDPRFVPLGAPVFLATTHPLSSRPLERLMLAQDTGGAIRGAIRSDFYWGTGADAGTQAGRMRQAGRMWLFWPRGEPLPPR